jgi:hypothetical protein
MVLDVKAHHIPSLNAREVFLYLGLIDYPAGITRARESERGGADGTIICFVEHIWRIFECLKTLPRAVRPIDSGEHLLAKTNLDRLLPLKKDIRVSRHHGPDRNNGAQSKDQCPFRLGHDFASFWK